MAEIIEMPKLSDTMSTGTLVKWLKKEGDTVGAGDIIAEVETDKATMEVENFEDGVILKLYAQEGSSVPVGGPICAVGEKGEDAPEVDTQDSGGDEDTGKENEDQDDDKEEDKTDKDDKEDKAEKKSKEKGDKPAEKEAKESEDESDESDDDEAKRDEKAVPDKSKTSSADKDDRIKASPLARKIAEEKGVDLRQVKGTGPAGRIIKNDVLKAAEAGTAVQTAAGEKAPAAAAASSLEDKEFKVSNMRASIAKALVSSKTEAPHFYLQMEVDGAPLTALRESLNGKLSKLPPEQGGIKFTVNDLILKASAEAVRRVPEINRAWKGDKIVQYGQVHLAFGVAVEEGLLTPVIRQAEGKGLRQISAEARELIGKARNKKLKPDEMTGSTLTVTNLGMFGISDFYGIINPPNAAILSVGATVKTPIVDENDEIQIGYRMKVGLSGDHRVIDGAVGAQYLAALKEILEAPAVMLV